jgi:hypothetical protein
MSNWYDFILNKKTGLPKATRSRIRWPADLLLVSIHCWSVFIVGQRPTMDDSNTGTFQS